MSAKQKAPASLQVKAGQPDLTDHSDGHLLCRTGQGLYFYHRLFSKYDTGQVNLLCLSAQKRNEMWRGVD